MYKAIVLVIITSVLGFTSYSQTLDRQAFTSGNGSATSVYVENVQYTIGQFFVTNTLSENNIEYLTQGFEQPNYSSAAALLSPTSLDLQLAKMNAYPNPAVDYADLVLNLIDDNGAIATIIDMWGKSVRSQDFKVSQGQQKLHFTFGSLVAGLYTIKVVANSRVYDEKLLIIGVGNSSTF